MAPRSTCLGEVFTGTLGRMPLFSHFCADCKMHRQGAPGESRGKEPSWVQRLLHPGERRQARESPARPLMAGWKTAVGAAPLPWRLGGEAAPTPGPGHSWPKPQCSGLRWVARGVPGLKGYVAASRENKTQA